MRFRPIHNLKSLVSGALQKGWTSEQISLSCAWGAAIGLFPILGFTIATLFLVGFYGKLNHAILQGFNYVVRPLKWLLIFPFIRLGEVLLRSEHPFSLSLIEFTNRFREAPLATLGEFGMTFLHAVIGWLVIAPFALVITYILMHRLLRNRLPSKPVPDEVCI